MDKLMKIVSVIMALVVVVGMLALDSDSNIPVVMCSIGFTWLIPSYYYGGERE